MLFDSLGLPEAWQGRSQFTLLDADFGDGVTFIRLWERWKSDAARPRRLHVVALRAGLVDAQTLRARLRAQTPTTLHRLVDQLVSQWPLNLPGTHRLDFEGLAVTLTLAVGPLEVTVPRLAIAADAVLFSGSQASSQAALGAVWQETLPRLARDPTRICLAFAGGGSERGCLSPKVPPDLFSKAGAMNRKASVAQGPTERMIRQAVDEKGSKEALVIGAGIAGAGVAHALALRGWKVRVLDVRQRREQAHSGHLVAALTPMVTRDDDMRARLSRAGSLRAQSRWSHISQEIVWRCGALQLQRASGRIVDLKNVLAGQALPQEWVHFVEAAQASDIAGLPLERGGLYFPTAARIQPERLIDALLTSPGIERLDIHVERVRRMRGQWEVLDAAGEVCAQAPQLILAAAQGAQEILHRSGLLEACERIPFMHQLGGEITLLPEQLLAGGPRCIVSGDGYVLPSFERLCAVGSSYIHGAQQVESSLTGKQGNVARAASLLGQHHLSGRFNNTQLGTLAGWAGWRAVLPGRLPGIGPVGAEEGLWVAAGFASRGLTWSSLAGDLIAAALNAEPLPLERDIMDKISQT
jgi:tRNA 5-methylaminomethyl-2-thiouridine biosynthesis bifunctional protein